MINRIRATHSVFAAVLVGGLAAATAARADAAPDDTVARGKYLATAADCMPCHSGQGQPAWSGGLYTKTPFGSIASPNITPDNETGIGTWNADQFYGVLHRGLSKDGSYLYPIMPFPWYTKVTRADSDAIFAYLKTLPPAHAPTKPNHLEFPFSIRTALVTWRTAFFHEGEFQPDPGKSDQINRGAYLVTALGHCGECHGEAMFGASSMSGQLQGGKVDNWYAPNITSDPKQGIGSWSETELVTFFKKGAVEGKTVAVGPMAEVVHSSLSNLSDADLTAIAAYLKSTKPEEKYTATKKQDYAGGTGPGAELYLSHCASCHQSNGAGVPGQVPPLAGNGAVTAEGPQNVIRVVVGGLEAHENYRQMPALGAEMNDQEIADVVNYVRNTWSNAGGKPAGGGDVASVREQSFIALSGDHPACSPAGQPALPDTLSQAFNDPKNGMLALLQAVTPDNMIDAIGAAVNKAKALDPHAAKADLVNGLTNAYCPVVAAAPNLDTNSRRWQLQRFAQVVYSQLTDPEKLSNK